VSLTQQGRQVDIERGEAYFNVAKDSERPFVVRAGTRRVVVLGTRFSVRRADNESIDVTVTEGKVRIEGPESEPLQAGVVAQLSKAGVLLQKKTVAEVEESLSWRQGILIFHGRTLAEAAAEFNRYNSRKITIASAALGRLRVSGSFRATNIEGFVRLLERGYPLQVVAHDDDLTLAPR
jgi:transmembrane sensor